MSINYFAAAKDPKSIEAAARRTCMTFSISGEDHTMGNALRSMLTHNLDCEFAGYSMPHPTQQELNLRLQTLGGRPALSVLEEAIGNLQQLVDHVGVTFESAAKRYHSTPMADTGYDDQATDASTPPREDTTEDDQLLS